MRYLTDEDIQNEMPEAWDAIQKLKAAGHEVEYEFTVDDEGIWSGRCKLPNPNRDTMSDIEQTKWLMRAKTAYQKLGYRISSAPDGFTAIWDKAGKPPPAPMEMD